MIKRLLYITHHQLDQNNGGCNASKGFLQAFASLCETGTVMCHDMVDASTYIPQNMTFMPLRDHRNKVQKMVDMYRGRINGYYYFVREHLREHHYDVVVIDHSFSGAGLPAFIKRTGAKLITIHHNVERDYLRDNSQEKPLFYRFPFLHYAKQAEMECLQYSDVNLTVTEHDAKVFRKWYPESRIQHWGIFEYQTLAQPVFEPQSKGQVFVISGSLYFEQSLRPIIDFVKRYWPLVLEALPEARLIIPGRNPSAALTDLCSETESITIIPNPENIGEIVRKADYYICPIFAGSGLKLRIFDGLKQGLPVICHEVAANGYERIAAQGCLFTYHDTCSFAESLHYLVTTTVTAEQVFKAFQDMFSLEAGKALLEEILKQNQIL